jgi:hypothetical protein
MLDRIGRIRFAATLLLLVTAAASSLSAQAIDDGLMMPKKTLNVGIMYAHDSWNRYWEGELKRSNENIGTLTAQSISIVGHYGVTDRLSLVAMLPYVWTRASQGTLHGLRGVQDLTFAAKYRLLSTAFTERGRLNAVVGAAVGIPASDYTPDFLPLSIGLGSRHTSGRLSLRFDSEDAWFIDGSAAHTWRKNVKLDRVAYYTDGQLYLTNQVAMPDVFDWKMSAGFHRKRVTVPVSIWQQRTLGGGDIRRQDMPFVSNRMDFTKAGVSVMYGLTVPTDLALHLGVARTLNGRNVGQATTITAGAFHTFRF